MAKMKKRRLSYSKLNLYETCGYKYYLSDIKKVEPFTPIRYPLVVGIAFHSLVDNMYEDCDFKNLDDVWDYLRFNWKKQFDMALQNEGSSFATTKGSEQHLSSGYGLIANFFKFAKDENLLIKPFDHEWYFRIDDNDITISGKVDLLLDRGEYFEIWDYKTSWKVPTQEEVDDNSQLSIYDWAVKTMLDIKKPVKVGLLLPRKKEALYSVRTENDHKEVLGKLHNLNDNIELGNFPPNTKSCRYCEFKDYCKYYKK